MREHADVSLRTIRQELGQPIYAALLEIQKYRTAEVKSLEWIQSLECLHMKSDGARNRPGIAGRYRRSDMPRPSDRLLGRTCINPFDSGDYIAVSYVWDPAPGEDSSRGRYRVESRRTLHPSSSRVRDVVWDRVSRFAAYVGCPNFWIDQECINQKDEGEKEVAMQCMDLVYSHSDHSVALLTVHIGYQEELDLLAELLSDSFVADDDDTAPDLRLNSYMLGSVEKILELLSSITSDHWWSRAWTFQEDYRAGTKMTLLIPHDPSLEDRKRNAKNLLFGDLEGELCVKSAKFREKASRLCLAYMNESRRQKRLEDMAGRILQRAGKYRVTLQDRQAEDTIYAVRKSMSPSIFADVDARKARTCSDRLAIVANCCDYSVRLNTKKLQSSNLSLSLALLALYLLNGEILMNGGGGDLEGRHGSSSSVAPLDGTIFDFLKTQSLDSFSPPISQQLTFIKSCRFIRVRLTDEGIRTRGHLWELGPKIPVKVRHPVSRQYKSTGRLRQGQRRSLGQLLQKLQSGQYKMQYEELAESLEWFLDQDEYCAGDDELSFSRKFQTWMASEVADAIPDRKKVLRLGRLIDTRRDAEDGYTGIFVCDDDDERAGAGENVFTASWDGEGEELDKHVSLEVDVRGYNRSGIPMLEAKRWINGLIFFRGRRRGDFIFPWHPSLTV
ncbi:hypothetical protein CLAIMM_09929 [Cladophialophora immunda]|nr:hypothetical protein CLAIMM_09929 [Cladophialophora immunda]